jgi:hypothetical protein
MIETEGLTKKSGDLAAVENLTLKVEEGELFSSRTRTRRQISPNAGQDRPKV